jgi:hypothetical protein
MSDLVLANQPTEEEQIPWVSATTLRQEESS